VVVRAFRSYLIMQRGHDRPSDPQVRCQHVVGGLGLVGARISLFAPLAVVLHTAHHDSLVATAQRRSTVNDERDEESFISACVCNSDNVLTNLTLDEALPPVDARHQCAQPTTSVPLSPMHSSY